MVSDSCICMYNQGTKMTPHNLMWGRASHPLQSVHDLLTGPGIKRRILVSAAVETPLDGFRHLTPLTDRRYPEKLGQRHLGMPRPTDGLVSLLISPLPSLFIIKPDSLTFQEMNTAELKRQFGLADDPRKPEVIPAAGAFPKLVRTITPGGHGVDSAQPGFPVSGLSASSHPHWQTLFRFSTAMSPTPSHSARCPSGCRFSFSACA